MMVAEDYVSTYMTGLQSALEGISSTDVMRVVDLILETAERGNFVYICGNGGSASTASHMACDLAKGCRSPGLVSIRAIALTDSMAQLTAWANDTDYTNCFSGQLEGMGRPGDLLVAISGSGNSPNVLRAIEVARQIGMTTVGFAGFKGGKLKVEADYCMVTPGENIEQAEDAHMILEHIIATTLRKVVAERTARELEVVG